MRDWAVLVVGRNLVEANCGRIEMLSELDKGMTSTASQLVERGKI